MQSRFTRLAFDQRWKRKRLSTIKDCYHTLDWFCSKRKKYFQLIGNTWEEKAKSINDSICSSYQQIIENHSINVPYGEIPFFIAHWKKQLFSRFAKRWNTKNSSRHARKWSIAKGYRRMWMDMTNLFSVRVHLFTISFALKKCQRPSRYTYWSFIHHRRQNNFVFVINIVDSQAIQISVHVRACFYGKYSFQWVSHSDTFPRRTFSPLITPLFIDDSIE